MDGSGSKAIIRHIKQTLRIKKEGKEKIENKKKNRREVLGFVECWVVLFYESYL